MAFNYGKEKREFDQEWNKLCSEYQAAGMSEKDIETLYAFDWSWFCSRRRFINHTQNLPSDTIDGEDSKERSSLILKFNTFSVDLDEAAMGGRYGWVEQIIDVRIADRLHRLSLEDLELLTLLVIDGYTQTEVARLQACSQNAISKKYLRIKKYLK
ncbi:hypothetical protein MASR2M70_14180 [Bacillota bacterium]